MKNTYMIVINPESKISPEQLFEDILNLDADVVVKCTCFGVMIEGEEAEVLKVLNHVRKKYPYDIFIKLRGYPINDKRVCRAYRGGGPRAGFHQLDSEYRILPLISDALRSLNKEFKEEQEKQRLDDKPVRASDLEKIVEEVLNNEASSQG
ncbi:MAG: methanogenesis marker 6 protein [Candidatus Nezhaarchaeota archaeon]|nr:methanogenesis marker 6 protein [Candidatus Nezhaarchaeota archaeon]MCX8141675.1 methanogenesis marker 6 protein [Candidatus Nezhaarchaeota archaeon]MDW8049942.1 methanogenesis marker 6 protein [Nitrososphaerota archaeon]